MACRVLIVDDDPEMCDVLVAELTEHGYAPVARNSADEAFALIGAEDFDVVLIDVKLGEGSGLDLCAKVVANRPDIPVIMITAFANLETAVEAMRAGAHDFVVKPFGFIDLTRAVGRAAAHRALAREVRRLKEGDYGTGSAGVTSELTGSSSVMRSVRELIERLADSDASVLITGESGTGKEVVARVLHRRSRRKDAPLVAINCAALPEALLESELFGHVKGAFTDARASHVGLFAQADGGTLFLDEIGEMPLGLQAKLLRALQERKVRPVGGAAETPFDVRLIASTNRDLQLAVDEKRFRPDIYFRLNVVEIALPPLRLRGNDILLLAQHFVEWFASQAARPVKGISLQVAAKLLAYAWPGNVRELQNYMERAVALTRHEELTVEDLPEKIRRYQRPESGFGPGDAADLMSLAEMERRYVLRVVQSVGGSRGQAAKILGVDRKTLYRKLDRYGFLDSQP